LYLSEGVESELVEVSADEAVDGAAVADVGVDAEDSSFSLDSFLILVSPLWLYLYWARIFLS